MDVVIYHNPACGTSRRTLEAIRAAGIEPHVVEYLKTPPSRALLEQLIARAGLTPAALLRTKDVARFGVDADDPAFTDAHRIDAMMQHPALIERPLVATPLGVRLCRPSDLVFEILPQPEQQAD